MALNESVRNADTHAYRVDSAVHSGDIVVFGSGLTGVAQEDAAQRENGEYWTAVKHSGVFWFAVAALGSAIQAGTAVYASSTPVAGNGVKGTFTTTASGNTRVGTVTVDAAVGATKVFVRLGA